MSAAGRPPISAEPTRPPPRFVFQVSAGSEEPKAVYWMQAENGRHVDEWMSTISNVVNNGSGPKPDIGKLQVNEILHLSDNAIVTFLNQCRHGHGSKSISFWRSSRVKVAISFRSPTCGKHSNSI